MLNEEEIKIIDQKQLERQRQFKSVPEGGAKICYLGKEFIVLRNVFSPYDDSLPLVEKYIINPGEEVLDVCTGSGVIAVFSALKGAGKVVAVDINPDAVLNAQANAKLHGLDDIIQARFSDMFSNLIPGEQFDVITGNLPFRNKYAPDVVALSQWDTDLYAHKAFFEDVDKYLKPKGRIYLSQANFGAVPEMLEMARRTGFQAELLAERAMPTGDPRVWYAFELRRVQ